MSDTRAAAVIPTAAALISAVTHRDPQAVERILTAGDVDWPALAVVLADNVGCIHDPRLLPQPRARMRRCRRCGTVGKRRGTLCHHCAQPSPAELTAGEWVPGPHGIRRWKPAS